MKKATIFPLLDRPEDASLAASLIEEIYRMFLILVHTLKDFRLVCPYSLCLLCTQDIACPEQQAALRWTCCKPCSVYEHIACTTFAANTCAAHASIRWRQVHPERSACSTVSHVGHAASNQHVHICHRMSQPILK